MKPDPNCPQCEGTGAILRDFDGVPDDDYCPDCMADPVLDELTRSATEATPSPTEGGGND